MPDRRPPTLREPRRRERRGCESRRPEEGNLTRDREPLPTHVRDLPPLPDAARARLDEGLAAIGLPLAAAGRAALEDHLRLLLAWTPAINLTAVRDPLAAVSSHLVDSLTAVPIVRDAGAGRMLDLGSGGGYPGIPLAVAVPVDALLVEPIGKKARFLETAIAAIDLGQRVAVAGARAEDLAADPRQRGHWPLVTARAVAGLGELVELAFPLLETGGRLVAWKRGDIASELRAARHAVDALGGGHLASRPVAAPGLAGHVLVVATKDGRTPDGYPRTPAARDRRPW
jgi:16S rRNA (guanine527-N7)-methyltransferase